MPLTRIWSGAQSGQVGNLTHAKNWLPINLRAVGYEWILSGAGTSNYYLRLTGGGDPGIPNPDYVQANGSDLAAGTPGALTAGQWAYSDQDTLGYSTIYVRLSDSTDPDTKVDGYVTAIDLPGASENVNIPAGSAAISSNADGLSAITLGAVRFEDGYTGAVGSSTAFLRLKCGSFYFAGTGAAYIDLIDSAIAPEIRNAASANVGYNGLYLKGTALTTLRVTKGNVGLATLAGQTSKVDAVHVLPNGSDTASVTIGPSVTDVAGSGNPDVTMAAGATVVSRSNVDALVQYAGDYTQIDSDWNDAKLYGGTTNLDTAATCTTTLLAGGKLSAKKTAKTPTLTNTTCRRNSTIEDPFSRVTFTNAIEFPDGIGSGAQVTLDFGTNRKFTPVAV